MKLVDILSDKSIKKMAATILEAVEEISNKRLMDLSEEYLEFAKG